MERHTVFKGRRIEVVVDRIPVENGRTVEREIVLHPGAVVIAAVPSPGRVLILRQHRHAVGGELIELPAGTLEPGEAPEACAARELEEETGFASRRIRLLTCFWSSPGILREKMHLYLAEDLVKSEQHLDEDEVLRVEEVSLADAVQWVKDGRIADAKTVAGILYLAQFGPFLPLPPGEGQGEGSRRRDRTSP